MTSSLKRDLARWERNELSPAHLERHHPRRAGELMALYERLTNLGSVAVPDPQPGWERLRGRLADRPVELPERRRGPMIRRLVARPLAAAAAVILLSAAAGYAAAPTAVNHRLASVWKSVESLFQVEPIRPERSPVSQRGGGPGLVPSVPDDEVGDGDGDEDGDQDGDEVGDEDGDQIDDDGDNEREESSEGSHDGTDDDSSDDSSDDSASEGESEAGHEKPDLDDD